MFGKEYQDQETLLTPEKDQWINTDVCNMIILNQKINGSWKKPKEFEIDVVNDRTPLIKNQII